MKNNLFLLLLLLLVACAPSPSSSAGDLLREAGSNDTAGYRVGISSDTPPKDTGIGIYRAEEANSPTYDYDTTEWIDLQHLDPDIRLDIRYATDDNFVGEQMYACGRCFLRPEVARAVAQAHQELQDSRGLGLKVFDCYRPLPVQWKLWEKVSTPGYVADPRKGSIHNRGAAVDLTLVDADGTAIDMGTPYDFFGRKAYHTYQQLPDSVLHRRQLLKELMEAYGFRSIRTEWWHYTYTKERYPISEMVWKCPDYKEGR